MTAAIIRQTSGIKWPTGPWALPWDPGQHSSYHRAIRVLKPLLLTWSEVLRFGEAAAAAAAAVISSAAAAAATNAASDKSYRKRCHHYCCRPGATAIDTGSYRKRERGLVSPLLEYLLDSSLLLCLQSEISFIRSHPCERASSQLPPLLEWSVLSFMSARLCMHSLAH